MDILDMILGAEMANEYTDSQIRENLGGNGDDTTTTVTGSAISVSDVSFEEHDLAVKVSGVDDPATVKVMRYSKNLLDVSADKLISSKNIKVTQEENGIVCEHPALGDWSAAVFKIGDYSFFSGKTLCYRSLPYDNAVRWTFTFASYDESGNRLVDILAKSCFGSDDEYYFVVPENGEAAMLCLRININAAPATTDKPCVFYKAQLEFGNVATTYETPVGVQEITPSADGTVNGMTSTAPTMNVITNNADAVLEVTYKQSAKETFKESEYAKYGLPVLYMDGYTGAMTKDNAVTLSYKYGNKTGSCTAKWQGSSSVSYPKKNYTVKFDTAFEAVEGWGEHDKYCLKADWVDFSGCRNVVAAKLWGTVVKDRKGVNETLSVLPNGGAIDGFPCLVVINGKLHGLYNFTIPKDDWLMGMGAGTQEAFVCAEGTALCGTWNSPVVGTDFDLEYVTDEENAGWVQTSLNTLFTATNAASVDESYIDNTLSQYVDIASAIDYYVYSVMIGHDDGIFKNYILGTHDGTKWFWSAYDMDLIFGQKYTHQKPVFVESWNLSDNNRHAASFEQLRVRHKLMRLIYDYKKADLIARYKELRETLLSPAAVAQAFYSYASQIPMLVYNKEAELWKARPNTAVNNVAQIVSWYQDRVTWLDKEISEMETATTET